MTYVITERWTDGQGTCWFTARMSNGQTVTCSYKDDDKETTR
jgi:hypothetical protein